MPNALTFEIQIGNTLSTQIEQYTKELNKLLQDRTVNIKLNNSLGETIKALASSLNAVTNQLGQSSIKFQRSIRRMVAAGSAPDVKSWENLKTTLNSIGTTIDESVGKINDSLKKLGQGVDINTSISALREGISSLSPALNEFVGIMEKFAGANQQLSSIIEASRELANNVAKVKQAQGSTSLKVGTTEEAQTNGRREVETYINNINKLTAAIVRVENAMQSAAAIREKFKASGGDTTRINEYIARLGQLYGMLDEARSTPGLIGQKGVMVKLPVEEYTKALEDLKNFGLNPIRDAAGGVVVDFEKLLNLVNKLGNATPIGKEFIEALGGRTNFAQQAEALEKLANARETLIQSEKASMVNGVDMVDISHLKQLFQEIDKLQKDLKNAPDSESVAKLLSQDYERLLKQIKEAVRLQNDGLLNRERVTSRIDPIEQYLSSAQATYDRGSALGIDQAALGNLDAALQKMRALQDEILNLSKADYLDKARMQGLLDAYTQLRNTILNASSAVSTLANAQERINNKQQRENEAQAKKEADTAAKSWSSAVENLQKYVNKLAGAQELLDKVRETNSRLGKNIDTSGLEAYIQRLNGIISQLQEIRNSGLSVGKTQAGQTYAQVLNPEVKNSLNSGATAQQSATRQVTKALQEEKDAQRAAERATREHARAAERAAAEQSRYANAIENTTHSARNQSQVLSDLRGLMMQYFSIYGIQQFLSQMVQVTGELELQRRSLEVILGGGSAAASMYGQLRDLSQQSPYTFEELLKSHRQLAAFGIEAKDIYQTMKALTDIGAGLDVDVSRLILAYGHTRSYGYLSGIQNRQFETAGIDLVGALAQHYNKLADAERKAGRAAEYVSRKDIFNRMRTRDISFEDVQKVIMDLDSPGGKFYNMQERQFDTVGGKLRNLRNNYRIMLSEIGGSGKGIITFFLDAVNTLTENWAKIGQIIKGLLLPLGAMKLAMLAINKSGGGIANNFSAMYTNRLRNYAIANASKGGFWTGFSVPTGKMTNLPPELAQSFRGQLTKGIESGKMTKNMALQLAYAKQLPPALRQIAAELSGMSAASAKTASEVKGLDRATNLFRARLAGLGTTIGRFARSMVTSLINPATAAMGVMIGISEIINWYSEESARVESYGEEMRNNASRDLESISTTLDDLQNRYGAVNPIDKNGNYYSHSVMTGNTESKTGRYDGVSEVTPSYIRSGDIVPRHLDEVRMMADGIDNIMEELDKKMQVLDPLYKGDLFDVQKFQSQYNRVNAMVSKLSDIEFAKKVEEKLPDTMMSANNDTHNMFTDSYGKDIKDYQDAIRNRNNRLLQVDAQEARLFLQQRGVNTQNIRAGQERQALADYTRTHYVEALQRGNSDNLTVYLLSLQEVRDAQQEVVEEADVMASRMASVYEDEFKNKNPQAFGTYLRDEFNQLMSSFKVSDTDVIEEQFYNLYQKVADAIRKNGDNEAMKEFQKQFANSLMGKEVQDEIVKNLNGRKLSALTKPELQKLVDESVKTVRERLVAKFPLMTNVIKHLFGFESEETKAAINGAMEATNDFTEMWKKEAYAKLGDTAFGGLIKSCQTYTDWVDEARKKYKEFADTINKLRPYFKVKFGVDITSVEQFDAVMKKYGHHNSRGEWKPMDFSTGQYNPIIDTEKKTGFDRVDSDTASQFRDALKGTQEADEYAKLTGTTLNTGNNAIDKERRAREKAANEADRKLIRNLQNRQKTLQDAYRTYWAWYSKLGNNEDAAMAEVRKKFKTAEISDADLKNLRTQEGYIKLLQQFIRNVDAQAKKLNDKKGNKDTIENIKLSGATAIDNTEQKIFDDNAKRYSSQLDFQVKRLEKQYDLYKKIYELTGDINTAAALSGRLFVNPTQSKADDLRGTIEDFLFGAGKGLNVDFEKVFDLNDEDLEKYIGKLFQDTGNNSKDAQEKIAAVVSELKEWRNLEEQIRNEGKETYAKLIGDLKDYDTAVAKNNAQYEQTLESLNKGGLSDKDKSRAVQIADQKRLTENLQASIGYINLMNNAISMGDADFVRQLDAAYDDLNNRLAVGTINAADYAKEIEKLDKISLDYRNKGLFGKDSDFTTFVQGGLPGLQQRWQRQLAVRRGDIAESLKQENPGLDRDALNKLVEQRLANDEAAQKLLQKIDSLGLTMDKLSDLGNVVGIVTGTFDGLKQAAQSLSTMFDALGNEHMANFFSDFSDAVGGIGSIFAPVDNIVKNALSGNISGVVSSAISAPFQMIASPVTAFAQLHDKSRERAIEKLQEDVSKIEGYTKVISKSQERTLGYDNGNYIREMQSYYANNTYSRQRQVPITTFGKNGVYTYTETGNKDGDAGRAMARYYGAAGGDDISGYQQQYNLLIQKRKDYVKMYNKEAEKKNTSASKQREYKEQIAELDDQIKNFGADLANSLWGINFKDWAQQLGDALMTAFENGEDAAEAFKNSVTSIMQSVVSKMLVKGMIEPMFQDLYNKIFGYRDDNNQFHQGLFDVGHPEQNTDEIIATLSNYLGEDGVIAQNIPAVEKYLQTVEGLLNKNGNNTLKNSNSSMSSDIKGITEQTADILAAYLNAIRADVSVIRQLNSGKISLYMDSMSEIARSQVQYQSQIAENTLRNAQAAEQIVQSNADIYYILNAVVNDTKQFYTRVR